MATTTEIPTRGLARPHRVLLWSVIAGLLLLPAVLMRLWPAMNWTASDFVFVGVVLVGAGVLFELMMWTLRTPLYRLMAGLGILGAVLIIWVEAAVGIFH